MSFLNLTIKQEKCYDPRDSTITFVDREDECDFLYEGFKSPRALMSCGHAVTPTSLTNWCLRLLEQGESKFVCGQCDKEWSYTEVRKMALLTPDEMEHFEKTMASNASKRFSRLCPGCNSSVVKRSVSDLNVCCNLCTRKKGQNYEFCWQCLREWKGPRPRSDRCDNDGCCNEALKTLERCEEIIFESVREVSGCPSVRACPTCGSLVEHDRKKCKNVVCCKCKVEFCFVCLKLTTECLKSSSHFSLCSSGVAPRQISIPVWQQK